MYYNKCLIYINFASEYIRPFDTDGLLGVFAMDLNIKSIGSYLSEIDDRLTDCYCG